MPRAINTHSATNLIDLFEKFGNDEKCRIYLEKLRWPDSVTCIRCQSDKVSHIYKRNQFHCDACQYQFSVTAGTIFHDSHLPLTKWFAAIYLLSESKKGMSALQLKRTLRMSYKTAWYLCHRVREAVSVKHLDRYVSEFEFRFNNRHNPYRFRDTLLRLLATPNIEYKKLTKEEAA